MITTQLTDEQIETEGKRQYWEGNDLDSPDMAGHLAVQDLPGWLEMSDAQYQAIEAINTTEQYMHGDIASSDGDDCATCNFRDARGLSADRLRKRALKYMDECDDVRCRIIEGYWSIGKVGEVIQDGDYRYMIAGGIPLGEECEVYNETGEGTGQYYYNGPTFIQLLIPVLTGI